VPRRHARGAKTRSAQFAKTSLSAAQIRRSCSVLQRRPCAPKGRDQKKFTEPVALSSTSPGNFRLPPTAPGNCFGLLALRARCKNNLTRRPRPGKACRMRKARILRTANCPHFHGLCGYLGRSLWISVRPLDRAVVLAVERLRTAPARTSGAPAASDPGDRPCWPVRTGGVVNSPAFHNMSYRADQENP
jgi:hypothetical protein